MDDLGDLDPSRSGLAAGKVKMEAEDVEESTMTGSPRLDPSVVYLSDNDDSSESEPEPEVVPSATSFRAKKRPAPRTTTVKDKEPEFIDLTEEDNDNEQDMIISEHGDDVLETIMDDEELPELIEVEPHSKKELAEERRRIGNELFKKGQYHQALGFYTQALEFLPTESSYYGNRAACYMMLKKYNEALADAKTSLQIDPTFDKGYLRLVRSTLALGDVEGCENALKGVAQNGIKLDIAEEKRKLTHLKQLLTEIGVCKAKKDNRKLVFLCERATEIAVGDTKLKVFKAEALTNLFRFNEAGDLCTEILLSNMHCVEALCIRAQCFYQADNLEKAIQFLKQGLTFAPDSSQCSTLYRKIKLIRDQREHAAALYKALKFTEAKYIYLECVNVVKSSEMKNTCIESKLAFNLALITQRTNNLDESLRHVNRAIELNPEYFKAFVHRANVYTAKEMHEEAARDYEGALKIDPTKRELQKDIQNSKMAAKRAKRKDYYKILDVDRNASDDDIRKAYKKRALLHHPDRHASAGEEEQKDEERKFKDLGEAYEVLSDPKKRIRYDQGQDFNEGPSGGGGAYYDPYEANQIFNMFFNGGGGAAPPRGAGGARYHQFGRSGGCGGSGTYGYHRQ